MGSYICECCGKEFIASNIGRKRKFCSKKCQAKNYRQIEKVKLSKVNCIECGKALTVSQKENGNKFCSQSCSTKYQSKNIDRAIRICVNCGKGFVPNNHSQNCCCHECKAIYNNWDQKIEQVNCEYCGTIFERPFTTGKKKKYCSKICCDSASKEKRKSIVSKEKCEYCEKPLNQFQVDKKFKFCGIECANLASRTLKGTTRVCVVCGDQYEPHYKDQMCCSLVCSKKHSHKALVENNKKISICQMCGESFEVFFSGCIEPKYCESCRRAVDRDRCRGRRAVISVDYVINENDVYEKYNWTCAICGEKIDPEIKWPSPQSKSIDHIIPVSKGGSHTLNNLQPAHLGCNSTKGAKECLQDLLPSLQL